MPRSDLLLSLVRASKRGDQSLLQKTVEAIAAEERGMRHHVLADQLIDALKEGNGTGISEHTPKLNGALHGPLWYEIVPTRRLSTLILSETATTSCSELVEEQARAELLRSHGLEPRHRVLLSGPPGNGKTALAEALAEAMMVPLIIPRYESIIGSYLGETSTRLGKLFDYVRGRRCMFFLDEFDTLGKERGDVRETGEIKRVVSTLLLQVDALPTHVIIVAATNHAESLDRAVGDVFNSGSSFPPLRLRKRPRGLAARSSGTTGPPNAPRKRSPLNFLPPASRSWRTSASMCSGVSSSRKANRNFAKSLPSGCVIGPSG